MLGSGDPRATAPAGLLQPGVDVGEQGVQGVAQQPDRGDDRDGDARGDQAILDRGGAGIVSPELTQIIGRELASNRNARGDSVYQYGVRCK